jgi:flagellar hook-length control protein FliK
MSHPSISPGAAKADLNPTALFQAAPDPAPQDGARFEAELDRAQNAERARDPAPAKASGPNREEGRTRTADEASVREVAREKSDAGKAEASRKQSQARTEKPDEAPADEATPLAIEVRTSPETASPAGLPAEIAAILTALAAAGIQRQASGEAEDEVSTLLDSEPRGKRIALGISDLFTSTGKGDGSAAGQLAKQSSGQTGKQAETLLLKASPDTRDAQTLAMAAQAASGAARNPAETLIGANARAEAAQATAATPAALAGTFAARLEAAQQQQPQLPVTTPVGQRGWGAEVGNRVAWMIGRNESKADLVLTPPSLGKLGVSIQVNGDQTTAHFVAATQAARDALEQAMPRLREVLQQAGINLGQTSVGTSGDQAAGDGRETHARGGFFGQSEDAAGDADGLPGNGASANWARTGNGVIDTFA